MICYELLKSIQELTTNFENLNTNMFVNINHTTGHKYAVFSAKTTRTVSPVVTVTFLDNELRIETTLNDDHDPMTGRYSDDYIFFQIFSRKVFTDEGFIKSNHDFWVSKGRIGLDLF